MKIVENFWAVRAPPRTQLGELTALPDPRSWWGGDCFPSPRTHPVFGLPPFCLAAPPPMKNPDTPLECVLNGLPWRRLALSE